jgi:hypothetical protein
MGSRHSRSVGASPRRSVAFCLSPPRGEPP